MKVRESREIKKAEITAFLSLIFILMVTFTGSIVDAASLQAAKNYRRTDAERAMECLFAEYQKELLDEYDLFAFDAGYESGEYQENLIHKRLEYYGLVNSKNDIERIQFLSDDSAKGFLEQVSYYMEHKYGLNIVKDHLDDTKFWEKQEEEAKELEKEEQENSSYLDQLLSESESELPDENNPISKVEGLKKTPILNLVIPEGKSVSERVVKLSELPSHRELNRGYGDFSDEEKSTGVTDKLLLSEYILEHFTTFTDGKGNVLDYEVEYILAGKESDRENLKAVVNQILLIRFVSNYAYLQSSPDKKAEAEALAFTLSSVLAVPAITEAVAQGILLAWAFEDSLEDIRTLLNGGRVPFSNEDFGNQKGLNYEEYLQILLFLEDKEDAGMRCLDMIEQTLCKIKGLSFFKVDFCTTKLEIKAKCSFRRGITYTFPVYFGYQ